MKVEWVEVRTVGGGGPLPSTYANPLSLDGNGHHPLHCTHPCGYTSQIYNSFLLPIFKNFLQCTFLVHNLIQNPYTFWAVQLTVKVTIHFSIFDANSTK